MLKARREASKSRVTL